MNSDIGCPYWLTRPVVTLLLMMFVAQASAQAETGVANRLAMVRLNSGEQMMDQRCLTKRCRCSAFGPTYKYEWLVGHELRHQAVLRSNRRIGNCGVQAEVNVQ